MSFIYSDEFLKYDLGKRHPLKPVRFKLTYELIKSYGLFEGMPPIEAKMATLEDVLLVHGRDYVNAVRLLSRGEFKGEAYTYGFGNPDNPVFEGMYEASLLLAGASTKAMNAVLKGENASFNIAGGLHHAQRNRASGFCIFNDVAIVISRLLEKGYKVAYIDLDAHHGDGVQNAFYDTDKALTISLHESGNYLFPGTGFPQEIGIGQGRGYSVNVPLAPYTEDEVYIWAFDEIVPPLLNAFKPKIVVVQLGVDTNFHDPLAHLSLTTYGFCEVLSKIKALSKKLIALGGGGYDLSVVARSWTLAYSLLIDKALNSTSLHDKLPKIDEGRKEKAKVYAEKSVKEVKERIFPTHGL